MTGATELLRFSLKGALTDGYRLAGKMASDMADKIASGELPAMDAPTALRLLGAFFDASAAEL